MMKVQYFTLNIKSFLNTEEYLPLAAENTLLNLRPPWMATNLREKRNEQQGQYLKSQRNSLSEF